MLSAIGKKNKLMTTNLAKVKSAKCFLAEKRSSGLLHVSINQPQCSENVLAVFSDIIYANVCQVPKKVSPEDLDIISPPLLRNFIE